MNKELKLISEAYIGMLQPKTKLSLTEEKLDAMTVEEFDAIDEDQLDELSKNLLNSYLSKASHSANHSSFPGHRLVVKDRSGPDAEKEDAADKETHRKRVTGIAKAMGKAYPDSPSTQKRKAERQARHDAFVARKAGKSIKEELSPVNEERFDYGNGPEVGHKVLRENKNEKPHSGTITKVTPDKVHVLYKGEKEETVHNHDDLDGLPREYAPRGYKDHIWATYHSNDGHQP